MTRYGDDIENGEVCPTCMRGAPPPAAPGLPTLDELTKAIDEALSAVDDEWTTDELADLILVELAATPGEPRE
jgi:hypothetical protein